MITSALDVDAGCCGVQLQLQNQYEVPMNVDGHNARVAIFRIRTA